MKLIASRLHRLEDEALRVARTDVRIKKYLRLDLLLYEQAVAVHHRQAKEHGLT